MNQREQKIHSDISKEPSLHPSTINEVGLDGIELPLKIHWQGEVQTVSARVSMQVSLDNPHLRGIHMSRLYLTLHEFSKNQTLTPSTLLDLLDDVIGSQKGIALYGKIYISWKSSIKKKALKSQYEGWQTYPCFYEVQRTKSQGRVFFMGVKILYSSTCPCSAALSREYVQKKYQEDLDKGLKAEEFKEWLGKESSIVATPHSQRSEAVLKVKVDSSSKLDLVSLILSVESCLKTSVQVAVKRKDEQEFAHLNSQNLMYTEDAIRRIKYEIESKKDVQGYSINVRHIESLHPFDTIATIRKKMNEK